MVLRKWTQVFLHEDRIFVPRVKPTGIWIKCPYVQESRKSLITSMYNYHVHITQRTIIIKWSYTQNHMVIVEREERP